MKISLKLLLLSSFILLWSFSFFGQDKLVVFQFSGSPFFQVDGAKIAIKKGSVLSANCELTIGKNDEVLLVNNDGELIVLRRKGSFSYEDLCALKPKNIENNFTNQYLSGAYNQLLGRVNNDKIEDGVDYRGENVVLMRFPADSIRIYLDEISFKWDSIPNNNNEYYLLIKDLKTDKVYRKNSKDNFVTVKINDSELNFGTEYQWGIAISEHEPFDNIKKFSFTLLSKSEFDNYKRDLKKLVKDLKEMGLTQAQAKESICEFSKFCY